MAYKISNYSKRKAKKLGVVIKPSKVKHKKIAVFKNKKKVADIGDSRYNDFTTYTKLERAGKVKKGDGKDVHHKDGNPLNNKLSNLSVTSKAKAKTRRRLYKIRHNKNRNKKGTKSYFADKLLW